MVKNIIFVKKKNPNIEIMVQEDRHTHIRYTLNIANTFRRVYLNVVSATIIPRVKPVIKSIRMQWINRSSSMKFVRVMALLPPEASNQYRASVPLQKMNGQREPYLW